MAGTGIMAGIYSSPSPSPSSSPIEKIEDSPYPYPVNAGIPVKTGTGSPNTHGDEFIFHLYSQGNMYILVPIPVSAFLLF